MKHGSIGKAGAWAVVAAMSVSSAWAAHYYVEPGGTGDYTQASPGGDPAYCSRNVATTSGDVIHLAAGTYHITRALILENGVSVIGASDDPAATVLDSDGTNRNVCCHNGASVRNLTMRNGYTEQYQGGRHLPVLPR